VKIGLQKNIKKTACPPVLHTCIFTLALTRIRRHFAIYFFPHRGSLS